MAESGKQMANDPARLSILRELEKKVLWLALMKCYHGKNYAKC